jgi:hypothetical protein
MIEEMKNVHILPTDRPSRLLLSKRGNLQFLKDNSSLNLNNHFEGINKHVYITSDEEIKEGEWVYNEYQKNIIKFSIGVGIGLCKKIILTTDPDLIKDGVQAIDDEFLEWFVKNPSCEEVDVKDITTIPALQLGSPNGHLMYKITIPQEELKQYPIGGYAPGNYTCTCVSCKTRFQGDKRAVQCEPCAIEMVKLKIKTNDNGGIQIDKQETLEEVAKKQWGNVHRTGVLGFIEGAKWQAERMYTYEEVFTLLTDLVDSDFIDFTKEYRIKGWDELTKWIQNKKKK